MHEMFKRNMFFKIASIVMAILLWGWVTYTNAGQALSGDQTLNISLMAKSVPDNVVIMSELPLVRIQLRVGNTTVSAKDLVAYLDLSGAAAGEQTFDVKINPIPGVQVLDVQPKQVTVTLDTIQEKTVPVSVKVTGTPASGFEAAAALVRPSAVNVRGPASILANLEKVMTDVSVEDATESIDVTRPVTVRDKAGNAIIGPDPMVNIFNLSPDAVQVIVPVMSKSLANKRIALQVSSTGEVASGMTLRALTVTPQSILVYGPEETLKTLDTLNVGPVDISGLSEDKVIPISLDKLKLPQGVTVAVGTSLTVLADIGPAAIEKTLLSVPVQVRNLPEGLVLEQTALSTDISVRAYPEVLAGLNMDQLKLWVDASGFSAGSYPNTPVYWELPSGVEMVSSPQLSLNVKSKT